MDPSVWKGSSTSAVPVALQSFFSAACGPDHVVSGNPTGCTVSEDVQPVEFMYLVFTRMPGESYCR